MNTMIAFEWNLTDLRRNHRVLMNIFNDMKKRKRQDYETMAVLNQIIKDFEAELITIMKNIATRLDD